MLELVLVQFLYLYVLQNAWPLQLQNVIITLDIKKIKKSRTVLHPGV